MADRWAVATGNWSSTATWNGGTLPTSADDVYLDGFTVTLDQDIAVLSLRSTQRTGGTIGGRVPIATNRTISADIYTRESVMFTLTGAITVNIIGTIYAGGQNTYALTISTSNIILNITGNIIPSTTTAGGAIASCGSFLVLSGSSTVNITGTITGASAGTSNRNVLTQSSGTMTINGNLVASLTTASQWNNCINFTGGALIVNGDIYGGGNNRRDVSAIGTPNQQSGGTITVNGNLFAGSSPAIITNGTTAGFAARVILNGNMTSNSDGTTPIHGNSMLINSSSILQHSYRVNNAGSPGVARSLYTGGQNLGQPTANNVRQGTLFGISNEFTGTLAVPPPSSVAFGVPVDNTSGVAAITPDTIRAALGLGSANLDTQLAPSTMRASLGLASANLDVQLSGINVIASGTKARTDRIPNNPATSEQITSLQNNAPTEIF